MHRRIRDYWRRLTASWQQAGPRAALTGADRDLIARIRARNLTYLTDHKLTSLVTTVRTLEENRVPGIFLETGCALGGSAILIASLKSPGRPFLIYDVFEMIPPPSSEDTPDVHQRYRAIVEGKSQGIGGDQYYGYMEDLYGIVQSNLKDFGIDCQGRTVTLIKGRIEDTMIIDQPVALAHVDVDWYQPVLTSLQRVSPNLVVGGSIILDDYHDWDGCRKAADEFLRGVVGQFDLDDTAGSMKLTRLRNPAPGGRPRL
jgi:asparagine synthase (glutamine-hydrolysing)